MIADSFFTLLTGALFGVSLGLAACDTPSETSPPSVDMAPPGSYDLCLAHCDALLRCQYSTAMQTTNCKTSCNDNIGNYADIDGQLARACKNASEIRVMQLSCYLSAACLSGLVAFEAASIDCTNAAVNTHCEKP